METRSPLSVVQVSGTHSDLAVTAGTIFLRENEISKTLYIIRSGQAQVFREYHNRKVVLGLLGPGDVCGEMSFIDGKARSASVEALTDVNMAVVQARESLAELPSWAELVFSSLAMKLRNSNEKLTAFEAMADFHKKVGRPTVEARAIFTEVKRFLEVFLLLCDRVERAKVPYSIDPFLWEWKSLLGSSPLSLNNFWKAMKESQFVYTDRRGESSLPFAVDRAMLEVFEVYLQCEIGTERFLLLSDSAMLVFGRIMDCIVNASQKTDLLEIKPDQLRGRNESYCLADSIFREGVADLTNAELLSPLKEGEHYQFECSRTKIVHKFQRFLKWFDPASMGSHAQKVA